MNWLHTHSEWWGWLYLASEWIVRLVLLLYVPERRTPAAARTWLLLIFLFPWPGLVLFLLVGRIHMPVRRRALLEQMSIRIREAAYQLPPGIRTPLADLPPTVADAAELAETLTAFPMLGGNSVELLDDYTGSLNRLAADLDAATQRIHLLYYIYADDEVASQITEALERAAKRGVKCRLLLDGIGAKSALRSVAPRLRRIGIEVTELLPVRFFRPRRPRLDIRNHRKLAIIDGTIGYVGSQNIVAPKFVPGFPNEELVARVTGPVVAEFEAVFLEDRLLETGAPTGIEPHLEPMVATGSVFAQLVPSSPGYRQQTFATLLLSLIHQARHRLTITTPYCVPDEPFLAALRTAVARGVEVRLIVPRHSNQRLTVLAQNSFFTELLDAGVQIFRYRTHFLHAKSIVIDDDVVIVGSSNMDIRSFVLNAEANLLIHDATVARNLRAINERHFANSDRLTIQEWNQRSFWVRVAQNTARMADSFL